MKKIILFSCSLVMVFALSACGAQKETLSEDAKKPEASTRTENIPQTKGSIPESLLKTMSPAIDKWQEATKTPDPTSTEMEGFASKYEYFMKKNSGAIMEYMKNDMKKYPTTTTPKE